MGWILRRLRSPFGPKGQIEGPSASVTGEGYSADMGIARRRNPGQFGPLPAPDLRGYEGRWVAVKGGKVIASGATTHELAAELARLGDEAKGAIMQRAPRHLDAVVIGVG